MLPGVFCHIWQSNAAEKFNAKIKTFVNRIKGYFYYTLNIIMRKKQHFVWIIRTSDSGTCRQDGQRELISASLKQAGLCSPL